MRKPVNPGTVYLVGAGPGAPDLITVRGLKVLQQANVVVYDRLVHPLLLEEAHPLSERIYVGKEANRHVCPQEEVNRILIEKARKNRSVVRLKGGDPFVFGRGGEEALALVQAGIPFEIVPGVTSAISVPAFAGIPVTHRGIANTFTVVTGHTCGDERSEVEWNALAKTGTLVILMGLGNLSAIARRLIESGRSPATPIALIRSGSTAEQRVVVGTLENIEGKAAGFGSPATIVVGEVVHLHHLLDWFQPEEFTESLTTHSRRVPVDRPPEPAFPISADTVYAS